MKAIAAILLISLTTAATSAAAREPPNKSDAQAATDLRHALGAMASAHSAPPAKSVDRDRGDDNAAARAIQVVCSKETPAARRSAICPAPVSPD
jgi:hypothetical protein